MIENIKISYTKNDVSVTLSIDADDDNLPYNLAELFSRVIRDTDANEKTVLEQINEEFLYDAK